MIQDLYLLYKETGNIKPFYDFVLKLSQIKCRKLGFNYQRQEISVAVAGDLYIAIVTGKVKEDAIDIIGFINNRTRSICFQDLKHPIYKRTVFCDPEELKYFEDTNSIIPFGSQCVSKRWRTEDFINELREYAGNHTTKECAERFGYTYNSMRDLKNKYNIKTKKDLRPFESREKEVLDFVKEKSRSLEEIMEQFECSKNTAFLFMKKHKIAVKQPESKCKQFDKQIREMRLAKATWKYISDKLNIPFGTLYSYVKKEGIE